MKYYCLDCKKEFDEPAENKDSKSRFVRLHVLNCVYCGSKNWELSIHGKLLIERKIKINKIEKSTNSD